MGWLGKLFGGGATVAGLRKAIEQKNFAEASLLAEQLAPQQLEPADATAVAQLRIAAGDGLARLNLNEAIGLRNSGAAELAEEHLQLALEQAVSQELRQQVEQLLAEIPLIPELEVAGATAGGSCASCGPPPSVPLPAAAADLPDAASQMELVLTSYPVVLADRYRQKSDHFLQAFLLSHSGDDAAALPLWQQVGETEQDELYWFEFGAALARSGSLDAAGTALEKALQRNPGLVFASEALVAVLLELGEVEKAQQHLQQMLARGQDPAFCHAQLALLYRQQQRPEQAGEQVRLALAAGVSEPTFLLAAASVLEQAGELADAEAVLQQIPGGGCGGGVSLPLAEFLLRQKRDLAKILDAFNAACRQEPDNPRWQLRVAQTYLARDWQKDGVKLLRMVVGDPRLEPELQQEAELLLAQSQG